MKHISFWASRHIWLTRFLIFLIYILLNLIGWFTGDLLKAEGIKLDYGFFLVCLVLTTTGLFIYPHHNKKISSPKLYRLHKIADVMLGSATFLLIVFIGHRWDNTVPGEHAKASIVAAILPENNKEFSGTKTGHFKKISSPDHKRKKSSFREWRKKMKAAFREIRQAYREGKNGERIALITLSIVGASILIILLAALSCSIACSGGEVLAYLLFIAGTTGIIYGLVKIIQGINKKYPKRKPDKEPNVT